MYKFPYRDMQIGDRLVWLMSNGEPSPRVKNAVVTEKHNTSIRVRFDQIGNVGEPQGTRQDWYEFVSPFGGMWRLECGNPLEVL